ncbi:hypothetical protein AVEN_6979-1 [Araneus ventricosus]|uniref:Uncharacterized protein n=1 Tax=Araneus ventricosus TaxID=182803 RepID=A0A4Y2I4F8_ARAVE|nr:hypothetical protein AVEN_6979-1 [Araneus ventricosus]
MSCLAATHLARRPHRKTQTTKTGQDVPYFKKKILCFGQSRESSPLSRHARGDMDNSRPHTCRMTKHKWQELKLIVLLPQTLSRLLFQRGRKKTLELFHQSRAGIFSQDFFKYYSRIGGKITQRQ